MIPQQNSQYSTDVQKVASITTNGDGSLNFNDYAGNPIIQNFTRQTTVNATTMATMPCATSTTNFSPSGCGSGQSLAPTFALTAVDALN